VSESPSAPIPLSGDPPALPSVTGEGSVRSAFWRIFGTPSFFKLWLAQMVSSLGDWTGLIAIIAIANRVTHGSGAAIGLVMVARMLPGFVLAPIGGAFVDRWNRKIVMVTCDIGRAGLLILLPFWDNILGIVLISFCLEVLSLLWGPAKDASVPNVVASKEQLASANSLNLVAGFGTFPLGAIVFSALAGVAAWLGGFSALHHFSADRESLAIWLDSLTFVCSALLISRLVLPESERKATRIEWMQTYRDIVDGLRFIRADALVRGVMIGLAGGLLGGGAIIPLGAVYAKNVLHAGSGGYGLLTTALGIGAATGVFTLLALQRRVPKEIVFQIAVVACGTAIVVTAILSSLAAAIFAVVAVGAFAGVAYVGGYALLQEYVADELRGRVFGALYTVVRLSLLLSLTLGPFTASIMGSISNKWLSNGEIEVGSYAFTLQGVRLALALGGAMTIFAGLMARRRMHRALEADAPHPFGTPGVAP
jgi:dTMP kinase